MRTKLLAWMGPLFLVGCAQLWGPFTGDNKANCVVTPGICSPAETCSPELEHCVPVQDGGTPSCSEASCPTGQSCDIKAGRCVPSDSLVDLFAVRPRTGPLSGLSMVTIEGRAFTAPAEVRFGGIVSPMVTVLAADRITAAVPPAAAPGLIPVQVNLLSGMQVTKDRMFGYALSLGFSLDSTLDTQSQGAGPLIIADLNNDQKPDVAIAHNNRISTYFGSAAGPVFQATTQGASTGTVLSGKFVSARVNGDAFNDLVLADPLQGNVVTLLSDGAGRFSGPFITAVGSGLRDIALADVSGDQKPDLLVAKSSPDQLLVFTGQGDGSFSAGPSGTIGVGRDPCSLAVGLFDGDARPDVAMVLCQDGDVRVHLNTGTGSLFGPPRPFSTRMGGATPRRIVVADVNADQKVDLVVSNSDLNTLGHFSVLLSRGDGDFMAPLHVAADGPNLDAFSVTDLDGDTFPDVVFIPSMGMFDGVRVLLSDGLGGLRSAQKFAGPMALSTNLRSMAVGDVTADGRADILYTTNAPGAAVLRNASQ